MAYEEMSREEAGGIFFRAPAQLEVAPAELAPQATVAKPIPVKPGKVSAAKIDTPALVSDVAQSANQMQKEMPKPELISPIDTFVNELISNWKPLAIGAGAAVGGELLRRSIQKKAFTPSADPTKVTERIDPIFTPEPVAEQPANKLEQLQKRVEAGREAGIGQAPVQPPVQAQQAVAPVQPPVAPQPAAPMAQQTPAIADAVATGESPSKSIQMDVAKQIEATPTAAVVPPEESGVKKRAAKTTQTFKSAEKLPEGITFRADLGPGDNWLFNTYGSEGRKAILSQFNEGKPAVSYERAKELSQMVQQERTGPAIPRDIAKERGIAPPETNYGKLGKAVKVAGAAGLGLTAAQMALAAQQAKEGDYSAAREFGFNLLGMIPGLGAAFNLGTYAPEAGAGEQKEMAKRRRMAPTID